MSSKKRRPPIELTMTTGVVVGVRPFTSGREARAWVEQQPSNPGETIEDLLAWYAWVQPMLQHVTFTLDHDIVAGVRHKFEAGGTSLPRSDRLVYLVEVAFGTSDDVYMLLAAATGELPPGKHRVTPEARQAVFGEKPQG